MSKLGGERYSVQKPLIEYVKEPSAEYITADNKKVFLNLDWQYVKSEEALKLRDGKTSLLFREVFTNQILNLNSEFISSEMIEDLTKRLERLPARIEGNLQAWEYLFYQTSRGGRHFLFTP